jgi:hypothetical protein
MKTYQVEVLITGTAIIEVEAENEHDAIRNAVDAITMDNVVEWSPDRYRADAKEI